METFRCPTCLGVVDANARRCNFCRANIRRKRPMVLGEETRIGANLLPIDRWMLERMQSDGTARGRNAMPPVAWHGRFATSPLAEPDFAATPSPVATPLSPPTQAHAPEPVAPAASTRASLPAVDEPVDTPPVVGALALDMYTMPAPRIDEQDIEAVAPPVISVPEPPAPKAPEAMVYVPPTTSTARPVVAHEELDPEVRALVDELYEQARAELAGGDLMTMPATEADPIEQEYEPFPALDEYELPELPSLPDLPELPAIAADEPPVADATIVEPVSDEAPHASPAPTAPTRGGWVPAFVADERRRKHL